MQIERYRIESIIGQGATATVFKAYDTRAGRYVALKLLHRKFSADDTIRARFIQEAKTIARLDHPAIIPILHAAQAGDDLFLVMPLMTGGSLAARLRHGPLSMAETINVLGRIAAALDYAHTQKIVHRDVKPGNILFDESGQAWLSDFGVIKRLESNFTQTGVGLIGTPAYMSPEQIEGAADLTGRSDIYSLGVVLFEMLSGHIPYDGDSVMNIAIKHLNAPIPSLRAYVKTLRPGWQKVINKAMAKKPEKRYGSGVEMLAAAGGVVNRQSMDERMKDVMAAGWHSGLFSFAGGMIILLLLGAAAIFLMTRLPSILASDGTPTPATEIVMETNGSEDLDQTPSGEPSEPGLPAVQPATAVTDMFTQLPTLTQTITQAPSPTPFPTATQTPTPTPTLTPTPTITRMRPSVASVTPSSSSVQVTTTVYTRTGPGMEFPIFGSLARGQTVPVIARDPGRFWYLVQLSNGQLAWVSTAYVTEPGSSVPVAATLPALPPTAEVTVTPITSTPASPTGAPTGASTDIPVPTGTNTPFVIDETPEITNTPFSVDD